MSNFIQGELWQIQLNNLCKNDGIPLPFIVYYDDIETGNAMGSHGDINELGAVYGKISTIPPNYSLKLQNILLSGLFATKVRKKHGNDVIFPKLKNNLIELEENGVQIIIDNKKIKIYFITSLFVGNNLALNSVLGFSKSFSSSLYCRICYISNWDAKKPTSENSSLLRTIPKYETDLKKNDPTKTGIKKNCLFNSLKNFHVIQNQCADIMHDLYEGICNNVLANILITYIKKKNTF